MQTLTHIVRNQDTEALSRLVESGSCEPVCEFFEAFAPMPYFDNFPMPREMAFIELFRGQFRNGATTVEERIENILRVEKYVLVNGFNENKALKKLEREGKARRVLQLGEGSYRIFEVNGTYVGVVKAGVGTAALSNIDKALQVRTVTSAIYVGTCVSLVPEVNEGLTVVTVNGGTVDLRQRLLAPEAQPTRELNERMHAYANEIGVVLTPVRAVTLLRGYEHEHPHLIASLRAQGMHVIDMESSFIVDALVEKGIACAVVQIPQDVFSLNAEEARSFSEGKKNVSQSYTNAMEIALYSV